MNREQTIEMATLMLDQARDPENVVVETRPFGESAWHIAKNPYWDFVGNEYRRKPNPQEVWIWRYPGGALDDMNCVDRRDCIGRHGDGDGEPVRFVEADQ